MDYFVCSEWVLGNREDLVKDILAELQPENGEVIFIEDFWPLLWKNSSRVLVSIHS